MAQEADEWIDYGPSIGMVQKMQVEIDGKLLFVAAKHKHESLGCASTEFLTTRHNEALVEPIERMVEQLHCSSRGLNLDFPELVPVWGFSFVEDEGEENSDLPVTIFPYLPSSTLFFDPDTSTSAVRKDIALRLARIALPIAEVLLSSEVETATESEISTDILLHVVLNWMELYQQQDTNLYQSLLVVDRDPRVVVQLLRSFIASESRAFLPFIFSPEVAKEPLAPYQNETSETLASSLFENVQEATYARRTHILNNETLPERQFLFKQRLLEEDPAIADIILNPKDQSLVSLIRHDSTFGPSTPKQGKSEILSRTRISSAEDRRRHLRARFSPSPNGPWTEGIIELPSEISYYRDISVYVETNGTVTMVLDTCEAQVLSTSQEVGIIECLTILEAHHGCNATDCDTFKVMGKPNFLTMPLNSSLEEQDGVYLDCPGLVEQPTIWFDKPMQKWRLLMHQYPSVSVNGTCIPQPDNFAFSGGYVETVGESVAGPWVYDFFQPAYDNVVRYDAGGERAIDVINYRRREQPRVILSPQGGLDGGYLHSTFCNDIIGDESSVIGMTCDHQAQPVLKSTTTPDTRPSGTLYLVTHGDTSPAIYPIGLSPKGIEHSNYMKNFWSNSSRFDPPKTIIASRVRDKRTGDGRRGQRMFGATIPLSIQLGIDITPGPLFKDDPYWTYRPDYEMLDMAISSLAKGTTMIAFWCYIAEFCYLLGTECDNFNRNRGEYYIFDLVDGRVVGQTFGSDGYAANFRRRQKKKKIHRTRWRDLPSEILDSLSALDFDENSWDGYADTPNEKMWDDFSDIQRNEALKLGYTKEIWDADDGELETNVEDFYGKGWLLRDQ